jgi:hypothetical protein
MIHMSITLDSGFLLLSAPFVAYAHLQTVCCYYNYRYTALFQHLEKLGLVVLVVP